MKPNEIKVPKEKLVLANSEGKLRDKELVTKPISYFRDAFNRFKKNKASIAGAIVIGILILYAIFAPICWSPPWGPDKSKVTSIPVASTTRFPVVPVAHRLCF